MRGFLLASLALVSTAIASTQGLGDNVLLGRSYPLLDKRDADVPALKIKRDAHYVEGLRLVERAVSEAQRAEGLTTRDVQKRSLEKRQLESTPCGVGPRARSSICTSAAAGTSIPRDSYANCNQNTGFCRLKCRNGFTYSRGVCVQNVGNCSPAALATCGPRPRNGVWTCPFGRNCQLVCFYGRTPSNGQCLDTKSNVDACGGVGCPASYNGVGTVRCYNYRCSIACPVGTSTKRTSKGQLYCA